MDTILTETLTLIHMLDREGGIMLKQTNRHSLTGENHSRIMFLDREEQEELYHELRKILGKAGPTPLVSFIE